MTNIVSIENGSAVTTSMAIADGVGYEHATVIRLVRDNISDFQEFGPLGFEIHVVNRPQGGGTKKEYALLNEQQATLLMTYMRNNDIVRGFKKRLVSAFYEMRMTTGRSMPGSFAEALQLAANIEREKEQALIERDDAIRTKAQIGSKREAVAMARASAETRRANKLADQIGDGTKWKSVKSIAWLAEEFAVTKSMYQQVGKKLKAISSEIGLQVNEIEDSAYGTVKAYHVDAIREFRLRLIADCDLLAKYRNQARAA